MLFFQKHSQLGLPCSPGLGLQKKAAKFLGDFLSTQTWISIKNISNYIFVLMTWNDDQKTRSQAPYHRKQAIFVLFSLMSARISLFPTKQDPQTVTGRDGTGMMSHLETLEGEDLEVFHQDQKCQLSPMSIYRQWQLGSNWAFHSGLYWRGKSSKPCSCQAASQAKPKPNQKHAEKNSSSPLKTNIHLHRHILHPTSWLMSWIGQILPRASPLCRPLLSFTPGRGTGPPAIGEDCSDPSITTQTYPSALCQMCFSWCKSVLQSTTPIPPNSLTSISTFLTPAPT